MEEYECDGVRIAYLRRGESGPPVVMLHHAGAAHVVWMPQINTLARQYRVYALDLPGFGSSAKSLTSDPAGGFTLARYTELIHRFLVEHELTDVSLIGNCLGGAITLNTTRQHPELIRAAVAMNPLTESTVLRGRLGPAARLDRAAPETVIHALEHWHTPRWLARATVRYWFTRRRAFRESPYTGALSAGYPAKSLLRVIRDLPSFAALDDWPDRDALPPICTIWGSHNRVLSASAGRALNERLRPDRAEFIADGGHVPMLEQAAEVTAILTEFLAAARDRPHASPSATPITTSSSRRASGRDPSPE